MKKKRQKKIFWIFLASILIILFFFVFLKLGFRIRFLTSDELQIYLSPLQSVIHTQNNLPVELNFKIVNKNFRLCETSCSFFLTSAYSGKTLNSKNMTLKSTQEHNIDYLLNLNTKGKGQRIYYFEAFCHNIRTALCDTEETIKYRSSITTVNYNYTDEEDYFYQNLKLIIPEAYQGLSKAKIQEERLSSYISEINSTIKFTRDYNFITEKQIEKFSKAVEDYYSQDLKESYENLNEIEIKNYESEIEKLEISAEKFNSNTEILTLMSIDDYSLIYDFYMKTNNSKAEKIKEIYENVSSMPLNDFDDVYSYDELKLLFEKLKEITKNYPEEKNITENKLWEIIEFNYNITANNTVFNLTGELCQDFELLKESISEKNISFNTTNITQENSGYNLVFLENYCSQSFILLKNPLPFFEKINLNYTEKEIEEFILGEPEEKCCVFKECGNCTVKEDTYPILFIHGHSFNRNNPPESSIGAFSKIQKKLSDELLVINAGDIDYASADSGYWSLMRPQISVRATYYYMPYYETDIIATQIRKEEGIESYSIRLKELIDIVLKNTGQKKIRIVAHSMGGLVTRNYLSLFGDEKVDKVILIGTPNNGISGRVEKLCSYFGDRKACDDMQEESIFLKRLERNVPGIPVYTIIGKGCDTDDFDGDGIVTAESSFLNFADNTYIYGECNDFFGTEMHSDLLDPDKYPEVYEKIVEIMVG